MKCDLYTSIKAGKTTTEVLYVFDDDFSHEEDYLQLVAPFKIRQAQLTESTDISIILQWRYCEDADNIVYGQLRFRSNGSGGIEVQAKTRIKQAGTVYESLSSWITLQSDDFYYFKVVSIFDSLSTATEVRAWIFSDSQLETSLTSTTLLSRPFRLSVSELDISYRSYYAVMSDSDRIQIYIAPIYISDVAAVNFPSISKLPWQRYASEDTDNNMYVYYIETSASDPAYRTVYLRDDLFDEDWVDMDEPSLNITHNDSDPVAKQNNKISDYLYPRVLSIANTIDSSITIPNVDLTSNNPLVDTFFLCINFLTNDVIGPSFEIVTDVIIETLKVIIVNVAAIADATIESVKDLIETNLPNFISWSKNIIEIKFDNYHDFTTSANEVLSELATTLGSPFVEYFSKAQFETSMNWPSQSFRAPLSLEVIFFGTHSYVLPIFKIPFMFNSSDANKLIPGSTSWDGRNDAPNTPTFFGNYTGNGLHVWEGTAIVSTYLIFLYVVKQIASISPSAGMKMMRKLFANFDKSPTNKQLLSHIGTSYDANYDLTGDSLSVQLATIKTFVDQLETYTDQIEGFTDELETLLKGEDGLENIMEIITDIKSLSEDIKTKLITETNVTIPNTLTYRLNDLKTVLEDMENPESDSLMNKILLIVTLCNNFISFIESWVSYIDLYTLWLQNPRKFSKPPYPS